MPPCAAVCGGPGRGASAAWLRATAWVLALGGSSAIAAPQAALVPVRLPLVGTRDTQVQAAILQQLDRLEKRPGERSVLVLEFVPPDAAAGGAQSSDFGRALELARFLVGPRLADVKTVAFLPHGAAGHAVLVALACDEIVMAADAVLGPAASANADEATRAAYRQIATSRRTVPPAVAVALVDPRARVARVATEAGERFVETAEVDALRQREVVLGVEELDPVPLAISGRRGRELGFVRLLASTPTELARGLAIPEAALAADPSLDGGWQAVQVVVAGAMTAEAITRARGRAERAIADGANFLCLRIDSAGGAPEQSMVLANWIAGLDPREVRTVAWVPREARGDAALVALACDEVVMHPDAVLGGDGAATLSGRRGEAVAAAWRAGVARAKGRSWSLPVAVAVPGLVVNRAVEQGSGRVDYFSAEELADRADRDAWQLGERIGTGPLRLAADRAEALGLAAHVVDDLEELKRAYGIDAGLDPPRSGWAEELLTALASPGLAWILLLVGGAGLYVELKTPGFGFGGFVAMVAFIVYFWSQYLHGTSGWLEVLLFLAGLVCLAAEIFVLPGFGVLGLGGGLLVIAALVLASQSFVLPANAYQVGQMQRSLAGILGAIAGVTVLGLVLRRWLPATPVLRHVFLEPPEPMAELAIDALAELVGRVGQATTRLAPAGKARLGGSIHDVTTDGDLIEPGTAVQVVAVQGGRIHVRRA
jgi:membrane-bound serine protease (ClpP class)